MVQVLTAEAARLLVEGLQARDLPLSKGKSKVLIDGPDKPKHALLQQLEALGIDESNSARNVGRICSWAGGGGHSLSRAAWRGHQSARGGSGSSARQEHTLASSPSLALTQGCFGVPRFWASLQHSSNPSESTQPKPHTGSAEGKTLPQRCWRTPRLQGAKTSTLLFDIIDWSSWLGRREFGKALQTSTPCRPRCAAPWPGSVVSSGRGAEQRTQRPPSCSRSCAWDGARSQRGTSRPTTAPRSTSWQSRPKRWAIGWTRHPFCGLTALHIGISPRARFSGKPSGHSSFLASWRVGHFGIGTCSSSWSHEASGHRKGLRGSGARTMAAASCATMDQAPCSTAATSARPCRQKETCTSHRRCVWLHARWVRNTGSSLHTAFFRTLAPFCQQAFLNASARFSGTTGPQMGCWRGTFSQTALRRAAGRCDGLAGQLWRSTMQETSMRRRMERYRATFCLGSVPEMAKITQRPWRGSSHWIRSRSTSTAKVPLRQSMGQSTKPWEPEAPEHTSGTGFCLPTTRSGLSRSRVMRHSAMWRLGELPTCAKRETTLQTPSPKKGQTHTSLLFESPRQLLPVLPWPSKRHVGRPKRTFCSGSGVERHQGCCATITGTAPASETQAKAGEGDAAPAAGQVSDWLSPIFPSRFSQDSHLDPRTFRGHSLQLGRVFDAGGRALDNAIIFCAKCGAVYWERADALCRQCSEFPGGRTSQLRKLRSGLFPN